MKIAFYAPLKSPQHPHPSGDRLMARLFLSALREAGNEVELVSQFRSWDGGGDRLRQRRLKDIGNKLGHRLLKRYARDATPPDIWFTYHVYHKAPDWLGPLVCEVLGIPYMVAEASYAPKQSNGAWQLGQDQCRLCIHRAGALISLNDQDLPCLRDLVDPRCVLIDLKPFLSIPRLEGVAGARQRIARDRNMPADVPWLVCVAMMRPGDKFTSFTRLALSLQKLRDQPWHLIIVGDGQVRDQVEGLFAPLRHRVTLTGLLDRDDIFGILKSSDVYVWPAVNEAYGMALLEAQACGLPVVASATGGVSRIVEHEQTGLLAAEDDEDSFYLHLQQLLTNPSECSAMGARAERKCKREHDYRQAVEVLANTLERLRQ